MESDSLGMEAQRQVFVKLPSDSSGQPRSTATDPEEKKRHVELFHRYRKNVGGGNYDYLLLITLFSPVQLEV